MNDVTETSVASPGTQAENPIGASFPAPSTSSMSTGQPAEVENRCIRCQADLTGDRRIARFCPRCGTRRLDVAAEANPVAAASRSTAPPFSEGFVLSEPDDGTAAAPPQAVIPIAAQAGAWLSMAQPPGVIAFGPHRTMRGHSNNDDVHSLMLLGYANAMYRLGWRYETGLGGGHQPQEALRCYFKAAKLGNIAALTRLAPQCVAASMGPAPMNPPLNDAAPPAPIPPPLGTPS